MRTVPFHSDLAAGRWQKLTITEQLANIGSEVSRVLYWKSKNDRQKRYALRRALELINFTLADRRWPSHRKSEVVSLRDVIRDTFGGKNMFRTKPKELEEYFRQLAYYSASHKP